MRVAGAVGLNDSCPPVPLPVTLSVEAPDPTCLDLPGVVWLEVGGCGFYRRETIQAIAAQLVPIVRVESAKSHGHRRSAVDPAEHAAIMRVDAV